jgi:hypothetical protein
MRAFQKIEKTNSPTAYARNDKWVLYPFRYFIAAGCRRCLGTRVAVTATFYPELAALNQWLKQEVLIATYVLTLVSKGLW